MIVPSVSYIRNTRKRVGGRSEAHPLHVEVVDVVPQDLDAAILVVDGEGEPDVAALPERVGVPLRHTRRSANVLFSPFPLTRVPCLIAHVEVRRLAGAVDAPREARLAAKGAGVGRRDHERLGPGAAEAVGAEGHDIWDINLVMASSDDSKGGGGTTHCWAGSQSCGS